ncbi:AraC family transcriptional regulator [Cohnella sp. GCM10027633]|uniref:AraC family transcriptional regulator n=1 Tax=unclassified Cohnella TaxID=2636738 RepID=UPI003628AF3B
MGKNDEHTSTPERLLGAYYLASSESFRLFRHEIDVKVGAHWHDFFEMAFVVSGRGYQRVNGVRAELRRGSAFLLTPADFHEIVPYEGETIRLFDFIFTDRFVREPMRGIVFDRPGPQLCDFGEREAASWEETFERMDEEATTRDIGSELIVQGCFERLAIDLARQRRLDVARPQAPDMAPGEASPLQAIVRDSIIHIEHHFREHLTLAGVAAQAGLSANYYSECFKKATGTTYQSYLQERRLLFAMSMLRGTGLSVTEICYASGFRSMPHFERAFKRKFGSSPRRFRSS